MYYYLKTKYVFMGFKDTFLSLINPESWNKECVGEFSLNSDGKWLKST